MEWFINLGYLGLLIGTFLSGTIIPLSSDMLLLGVISLGGNVWISLAVATTGNWLGGMVSYGLGWLGKWEWLERWFKVKKEKLEKQRTVINRYGVWIALIAWVPIIGNLGVISLGFFKVRPKTTAFLLFIGCFTRFLLWVILYIAFADRFIEWITR